MSESDSESQTELNKSHISKKQNDIINRREARRRKILENAKNRLDKLTGTDTRPSLLNNKCSYNSTEKYSDPEIDYPEFVNNYIPTYAPSSETTPNNIDWSSSPLLNNTTKTPPTKFQKILSIRLHIIASSALTYLMYVCGLSAFITHSLILFLTLEFLELVVFRLDKPLSGMENLILIVLKMSGIKIFKVEILIKVVRLFKGLVCDLGFFVFVFGMAHILNSWFVEETDNEIFYSF